MSNTATATRQFQVGTTYTTGEGNDYVWRFTVTARTAKFITLVDKYGDTSSVGVREWNGTESASPLGSYSMAPVISADRTVVSL